MVVALLALFVALDGPATAARLLDGGSIRPNSISGKQIRNRSLALADLSGPAVRSLRRTPRASIGPAALKPKSVDATKLADGAVGPLALADKGVQTADLADGAVGSAQLAPGAVTSSRIADSSVGAMAIADGSLQTKDVGDFYGAVQVDFKPFVGTDYCQTAGAGPDADHLIIPTPSAPGSGAVISDDVVAVTPSAGWPDSVVVYGHPGAGNSLRITACMIQPQPPAAPLVVDPGATTFQYVAYDQP